MRHCWFFFYFLLISDANWHFYASGFKDLIFLFSSIASFQIYIVLFLLKIKERNRFDCNLNLFQIEMKFRVIMINCNVIFTLWNEEKFFASNFFVQNFYLCFHCAGFNERTWLTVLLRRNSNKKAQQMFYARLHSMPPEAFALWVAAFFFALCRMPFALFLSFFFRCFCTTLLCVETAVRSIRACTKFFAVETLEIDWKTLNFSSADVARSWNELKSLKLFLMVFRTRSAVGCLKTTRDWER